MEVTFSSLQKPRSKKAPIRDLCEAPRITLGELATLDSFSCRAALNPFWPFDQ